MAETEAAPRELVGETVVVTIAVVMVVTRAVVMTVVVEKAANKIEVVVADGVVVMTAVVETADEQLSSLRAPTTSLSAERETALPK